MAARNRPHIFLDRTIDAERFTPTTSGRNGAAPPSPADPDAHSTRLRQSLSRAADQAAAERSPTLRVEGAIAGIYIQFEAVPGFELALTSLEPQLGKEHPELRAVTEQIVNGRTIQLATVFVPDGWIGKFIERFEQYETERTPKGNRKNRDLVERIADIRLATLAALWTDPRATFPEGDEPMWWELWLQRRDGVTERLDSFAEQSDVRIGARRLVLDDRIIVLIRATAEQLGAALGVLDDIAELRRPAEAFHDLADLDAADQVDFVTDLVSRLDPPPNDAPRTCLLDTGVAANHRLIAPALDPADLHTVEPKWTLEDRRGHGTMMAGTILYPELGVDLLSNRSVPLVTRLESVKILPNKGDNDDQLYGALTAQKTSIVEIQNPSAHRTFLLAVTAAAHDPGEASSLGQPTTWSSTIDALAAGRQVIDNDDGLVYLDSPDDRAPRLFVVSAGNVRRPYDINHLDRSDIEPAEDPAQAWNALVIGAYTTLDDHTDEPPFKGWTPLAPSGELSPFSRTSVAFKREWRPSIRRTRRSSWPRVSGPTGMIRRPPSASYSHSAGAGAPNRPQPAEVGAETRYPAKLGG